MESALVKEISLAATAVVASAILWWLILVLPLQGFALTWSLAALLCGLLWLTALALSLAFIRHFNLVAGLIAAVPASLIIFGRLSLGAVSAAIFVAALLAVARARARYEITSRRNYRTIIVFTPVTRYLLFALLVAAAGLSITSLADHFNSLNLAVPADFLRPVVANTVPGIAGNIAVDIGQVTEIATNLVNQQLTALTRANPLLTALTAIITLLIFSRLIVVVLTWPTLGLLTLAVYLALRLKLLRWETATVAVRQVTL